VFDEANPVPVTVIEVPPLPEDEESEIEGVTVKVAVADPPTLSIPLTVWAPGETDGTLNDATNPP